MRLLASESYNVAWFKLADFVARGEKERALTVHKLLMHSVKDEAIPYQLEGDILLAFDDEGALDKYHVAANLYKKSGKMHQAASVYEHVSVFKKDEKILEALFDVYHALNNNYQALYTFSRLAKTCLQKKSFGLLINLFHRYLVQFNETFQALLTVKLVQAMLLYDQENRQVTSYVDQAIDLLKTSENEEELYKFLSILEELSSEECNKAQMYIDKNY